jgi:hypothetical protein
MKVVVIAKGESENFEGTLKVYIRLPRFFIPKKMADVLFNSYWKPNIPVKVMKLILDPEGFFKKYKESELDTEIDPYLEIYDNRYNKLEKVLTPKMVRSIILNEITDEDLTPTQYYSIIDPMVLAGLKCDEYAKVSTFDSDITIEDFLESRDNHLGSKKILKEIMKLSSQNEQKSE